MKVFDYKDGILTNEVSVAPDGGKEFGPRHLDFHPTKPWVYVSIETQNKMDMYRIDGWQGRPRYRVPCGDTRRAERTSGRAKQRARSTYIPMAGMVYGAKRAEETTEFQGRKVFKGGENSIVVCAIDQSTGEPKPIQHIETRAIHPRTFHIDPSGRMLVAEHNLPVDVRDGDEIQRRCQPACRCFASARTAS